MSNLVTDHHSFWHGLRRDFARQTRDAARLGERKPPFPIEWLLDPPKPTLLEQVIVGWDWSLKPRSKRTRQITRIVDAATGTAWSPANTDQATSRLLRGASTAAGDRWQAEGRNLARELRGLPPLPVNTVPAWAMIAAAGVAAFALSALLLGKTKEMA